MPYKPGDLTRGAARRVERGGLDVVDRVADWCELPLPAQLLQSTHFREDLRRFNLYDTEQVENGGGVAVVAEPPQLEDGRLPEETKPGLHGVDLTGFSDNYWVGLSIMHTLFAREQTRSAAC